MKAKVGVAVYLYSFFNLGVTWKLVVNTMAWPLCPQGSLGTHCIGGWVGPSAGLDGSPLPGFDLRTAQPVASHYTDRAIPAYFILQDWNHNNIC
jgi:hypothetical protein